MIRLALAPALAALALAGCAAPAYVSPVEVTRFVGEAPDLLGEGPIALRAAPGQDPNSLEYSAYQTAVAAELEEQGYIVAGGDALQVALIDVERFTVGPEGRRGPVSVGVGGSTGSYGSGVGVGVGLDLSGPPPDRIETQLRVMIRPTGGGANLWEGRAHMTATSNSDMADVRAAAAKLADALFEGFPGRSGETIEVE